MRSASLLLLAACHRLPPAPAATPDQVPSVAWSRYEDESVVTNTGAEPVTVYAIEVLGTVGGLPGALSRGHGGEIEPGGALRSPVEWLEKAEQILVRTDRGVLVVDVAPDPPLPAPNTFGRDGEPLAMDAIDAVMADDKDEFTHCFRHAMAQYRGLTGDVVVRFAVSPNGLVNFARVKSTTLPAGDVEICLVRAVERLRFPAPPDGATVVASYPFSYPSE
jgi:TonB family protein